MRDGLPHAHTTDVPIAISLRRASSCCCRRRSRRQAEGEGVKEALRAEPSADEDPYHALMLSSPTNGPHADRNAINSLG